MVGIGGDVLIIFIQGAFLQEKIPGKTHVNVGTLGPIFQYAVELCKQYLFLNFTTFTAYGATIRSFNFQSPTRF